MQRRIEVDRLTATMGYASVPASYLLHAVRAGERFDLDPRDIIVELGRRKVVVGQEDMILGLAAEMVSRRDSTRTQRPDRTVAANEVAPRRPRRPRRPPDQHIGRRRDEVPTPALILDLARVHRNIDEMATPDGHRARGAAPARQDPQEPRARPDAARGRVRSD